MVTADTPLKVGTKLQAKWAGQWTSASVVTVNENQTVLIHWDNQPSSAFDVTIERSKLRYFPRNIKP